MALGAVFFSLPAALIGALYLSLTRGFSMGEALGLYVAFGLASLMIVTVLAAIPDLAQSKRRG